MNVGHTIFNEKATDADNRVYQEVSKRIEMTLIFAYASHQRGWWSVEYLWTYAGSTLFLWTLGGQDNFWVWFWTWMLNLISFAVWSVFYEGNVGDCSFFFLWP
jgi:hypothetical protein